MMTHLPYDITDKKSITKYAKKLINSTLREKCETLIYEDNKNKGGFGQLLEKYYFLYEPNSDSEADFVEAGLELKSSPMKQLKKLNYVSKERLVLNIINFEEVIYQDFDTSSFWKKNSNLLLVFYIYEPTKEKLDYKIKIVDVWEFSHIDLEVIKKDWHTINQKIKDGKAHELSEGDTLYLGACTKGSKGGNLRVQPNNSIKAKQRAYSLKQGYVNHIIASLSNDTEQEFGKLIPTLEVAKKTGIEDIVIDKFKKYYNKSIDEIQGLLNTNLNQKSKNFYANLTKSILGVELEKEIEEFKKADIIVKTVRLKENDLPKEDISFPAFKFQELVKQTWENSDFKSILERKFLFIFYKYEKKELKLEKVKFWNMPYRDIQEVRKMWLETKTIVKNGNIVKEIKKDKNKKEKRFTNFPSKKDNLIAHVRPHAKDSADTYVLPKKDILTQQSVYTKHCFWLNASYVKNSIFM
jgi:DNA mismatch repair protein MutH